MADMWAALLALAAVQTPEAAQRWREDVAVARRDFLAKDLSFSPARKAAAAERLDRLARDVPQLTD